VEPRKHDTDILIFAAMFAPGVPELMREFGNSSSTLGSFVVSVYVLGFAAGPMVFAPLSELYGRLPVYHATNVCFLGRCCTTVSLECILTLITP
jgi:MFS family permease